MAPFPIRDGKTKPVRIAFSPDGRLAYLTEGAAASVSVTVSVIDTRSRKVVTAIPVGDRPNDLLYIP